MIRLTVAGLAGLLILQACNLVQRRTPQEEYCRSALAELTRGQSYSIEDTTTTLRDLDRERVTAVTITYEQGPAKRLMTCFYRTGVTAPIRINYRGQPLSDARLRRLNETLDSR